MKKTLALLVLFATRLSPAMSPPPPNYLTVDTAACGGLGFRVTESTGFMEVTDYVANAYFSGWFSYDYYAPNRSTGFILQHGYNRFEVWTDLTNARRGTYQWVTLKVNGQPRNCQANIN